MKKGIKKEVWKKTFEKKDLIIKKARVPLYPFDFILCLTDNKEKFDKQFWSSVEEEELYASYYRGTYKKNRTILILLNFNHSTSEINYGTIAHEINHVKNCIFEEIGVKADFDNDEAESYLISWFTDTTLKWLKELNLIKKIKI